MRICVSTGLHHTSLTVGRLLSKNIQGIGQSTWRTFYVFLTSWWFLYIMTCFDVMTYFWRHDGLFDVMTHFWHHDELFGVMTCFNIIRNFLMSWRIFDVITYLITPKQTFQHHNIFWCYDELFMTWRTFGRYDVLFSLALTSWRICWRHDVIYVLIDVAQNQGWDL